MGLEKFIFPYWLLFAMLVGYAVFVRKMKVIPTLKEYGRDYEEYWSSSKRKKQLKEYKEVCQSNGLSLAYYKFLKIYPKVSFIVLAGWIFLLLLVVKYK